MSRLTLRTQEGLYTAPLGPGRFRISATGSDTAPAVSLVYDYPPGVPGAYVTSYDANGRPFPVWRPFQQLARVIVASVAPSFQCRLEECERVAAVALAGGSLAADVARITEAFNLFRNQPRMREESLAAAVKESEELLSAYWQLADWLMSSPAKPLKLDILGNTILAEI